MLLEEETNKKVNLEKREHRQSVGKKKGGKDSHKRSGSRGEC